MAAHQSGADVGKGRAPRSSAVQWAAVMAGCFAVDGLLNIYPTDPVWDGCYHWPPGGPGSIAYILPTMADVREHRGFLPDWTLEQAALIGAAIFTAWAIAFGFRMIRKWSL